MFDNTLSTFYQPIQPVGGAHVCKLLLRGGGGGGGGGGGAWPSWLI